MHKTNNKFWIASYSAHAEILDKLVGETGSIEKLCIDAGGLRIPKKIIKNTTWMKNIVIPRKTMHAKVLLKRSKDEDLLWLWTGNLRKTTFDDMNILMSFSLDRFKKKMQSTITNWFNQVNENILFYSDGDKILDVKIQEEKCLWDEIKNSLNRVTSTYAPRNLYIFSPWGASKLAAELKHYYFSNINVYTRNEIKERPIWADAFSNSNHNVWIPKNKTAFPHLKCMLLTEKKGSSEKIIWAYIGSANLTKTAIFNSGDKANVEYAVLFEGSQNNIKLKKLFQELITPENNLWQKRKTDYEGSTPEDIDDSDEALQEELDLQESVEDFERRNFCRQLLLFLQSEKKQREMEDHYKNRPQREWLSLGDYKIIVEQIEQCCFHLTAKLARKRSTFIVECPRTLTTEPPAVKADVYGVIDELLLSLKNEFKSNSSKKGNSDEEDESDEDLEEKSNKFLNVRFVAQQFIGSNGAVNKERVSLFYDRLRTLQKEKLKGPYKTFYSIWWPIILKLREEF